MIVTNDRSTNARGAKAGSTAAFLSSDPLSLLSVSVASVSERVMFAPPQVAVPAPDPALPPSFDPEGNPHRYRFLESNGGWIARSASAPTVLQS